MPNRNDPYSRPINATRLDGQMLQGEFYGEKASDKRLHGATGGREVHQVRPMPSVVPTWPEATEPPEPPKPKRGRPPGSKTRPELKNRVKATIDDIAPLDELDDQPTITEDDLFG